MKVAHLVLVGLAMFVLVIAAPAALGVSDAESGPVKRDDDGRGGSRYVFLGGFYGGK
jgi:hypothetical protein